MYEYNTLEGKIRRVEELRQLQARIACVPGKHLSYSEATATSHYLGDIISDLEKQIRQQRKARQQMLDRKVAALNKAMFEHWGTATAEHIWEELEKCASKEEIAQLYDLVFKPA